MTLFGHLPGPKMRIGKPGEEPIELERGQTLVLQMEAMPGNRQQHRRHRPRLVQAIGIIANLCRGWYNGLRGRIGELLAGGIEKETYIPPAVPIGSVGQTDGPIAPS